MSSDRPWGDLAGEHAHTTAAACEGALADLIFRDTFDVLHG